MKQRNNKHWPRQISWKEIPMVRLVLPLLLGIFLGTLLPPISNRILCVAMGASALGCLWLTRKKIPYRLRHLYAFYALLFWTFAGYWQSQQHLALNRPDFFIDHKAPGVHWIGEVREASASSFPRAILDIQGYYKEETGVQNASGRLLIYPENPLETGQIIWFEGEIYPIPAKRNPMDFDHRRYRYFQNIHHQAYLKTNQYRVIDQKNLPMLEAWRKQQIAYWKVLLEDPSIFSVATAMVLGYKDELPGEVRATYAQTGASHVLAVSGLHVGLIYLILTRLFRQGRSRKGRRVWKVVNTLAGLLGIWGFAMLTGASPSVVRAATMFSFILLGKQLGRRISVFNSIAASAFLLLLINPFWLFHIGFQLSYLAVLGIIIFQPRWYHLWIPSNRLADKIWTLITVSLAAQMATLPLTIYYFHQFPVFFWLSGLIVVPAAPFIIGLSIAITLFQYLLPAGVGVPVFLLKNLIQGMNWALREIREFPFSLVKDIYLPDASLLLFFLGIAVLAWLWEFGLWKRVSILLLILNTMAAVRMYVDTKIFLEEKIVFYHASRESLVDYFHRGNLVSLKSKTLGEEKEQRIAAAFRKRHRVQRTENWSMESFDGIDLKLGHFEGKILGNRQSSSSHQVDKELDFIFLRKNPSIFCQEISSAKIAIADVSNWRKNIDNWKVGCAESKAEWIEIRKTGAYTIKSKP